MKMNTKLSLFLILLYHVCHGTAEIPEDSPQSYDLVKMIEDIGSRITLVKKMKNLEGDVTSIISFLERLNKFLDLIFPNGTFNPIFEDMQSEFNNSQCLQDISYTLRSAKQRQMWAIKIIDALGKPSAGILDGNFKWLGDYHECTTTQAPPERGTKFGNFQAQYCSVPTNLNISEMNMVLPLVVGICVPDSCVTNGALPKVDPKIKEFIVNITDLFPDLKEIRETVTFSKETCHATSKKLTSSAIAMICLISFFVLLSLIGSSITASESIAKCFQKRRDPCISSADSKSSQINEDVQSDQGRVTFLPIGEDEPRTRVLMKGCKEFFNCFCVFTNGAKLLNTDSAEGQLPCLHGIRFLSMSWVIVCHTYAFSFSFVGNLVETLGIIDKWSFQIILNGFFSVDSFFLLSGFLLAYLFFQQSDKTNGKIPWLYFYVHRYVRLTPVYMICLGFHGTLLYYMSSGPTWMVTDIDPMCQKHWWWNLLYINNFLASTEQCMGWAWYLANDMQFFVISPLFLITLWRWPKIGYSIMGLFMCVCFATNFGLTYYYDLFAGLGNVSSIASDTSTFLFKWNSFFDKIYIKPYTRISPYLIGIALAYYLFQRRKNDQGKINWIVLISGWVIAAATTLTCLFVLYDKTLSTIGSSFYNATNRTVFALGLSWVIFTCLNGQGGPVNNILSWKLFIPLSRLTYSAYLIHPIVQVIYLSSMQVPLHFTHLTLVTLFLGMLLITYAFSLIVSLLFESPVIRLEKYLRSKLTS